jgi:propionyl-CoA carboxylase alpha chain
MPRTIDKVLVANRGEVARRVLRTLAEMGIASVAVYSDADAEAPHVHEADEAVRIGPPPSSESYLVIDRILDAARATGADAVHPGYGFLSENAEFARRCADAGLVFIGPNAEAIARMGSKIEAKAIMAEAGVPVIPGFSAVGLDDATIAARAGDLGYPILVKASAGGGGKGMRVVADAVDLVDALAGARREAANSFGDDTLLIERYLTAPRHVEVQIFGDEHGHAIHLFERECSIQRRHQKVIEEAPSPAVDADLRKRMGEAAVTAARAIGYDNAGTVEFVLDQNGEFYFLEVNTRLQVEHPVTEMITGLDLVRMQIDVARGLPLPVTQEDLAIDGHAIEVRLYAEDAAADFLPATGRVSLWREPVLPGLRIDSGVEAGSEISAHYDPMLAKVIAHSATRDEARRRLVRGLHAIAVGGTITNRDFLIGVLEHPAFRQGELDTHFIERHVPADARAARVDRDTVELHAIAATLYLHEQRRARGGPLPRSILSGWRNNRWRPQDQVFTLGRDEDEIEVLYVARPGDLFDVEVGPRNGDVRGGGGTAGGNDGSQSERAPRDDQGAVGDVRARRRVAVRLAACDDATIALETDGVLRTLHIAGDEHRVSVHGAGAGSDLHCVPRFAAAGRHQTAGGCAAPMTGVIQKINVSPGDRVTEGAVLLVLEAMKMEHKLVSHTDGTVTEVRVEVGQMVDPDEVLVVVEEDEEPTKG